MPNIARRDFLKYAPAAAGAVAQVAAAASLSPADQAAAAPEIVKISGTAYVPARDYPIQPTRYSDVRITDRFWNRRITTNAAVTIPFEREKLSETERGFSLNVLEAAVLSLATQPNAQVQTQVDAHLRRLLNETTRGGNSGFELAATHYAVTGSRALLDRAIRAADALYDDFRVNNPPFSGGEDFPRRVRAIRII
jgi:hypothetical protein